MRALAFFVVACGLSTQAWAGGDCSHAAGSVEKALCSDPALLATDTKLTSVLGSASAKLSEAGRAALQNGQRQWQKYVRVVCNDVPRGAADCLADRYAERLKDLETAVTATYGLTFRRTDLFEARKATLPGDPVPLETLEIGYPQIDVPRTRSEDQFNKRVAALAHEEETGYADGGADVTFSYDGIEVSDRLISVDTISTFYGHGAAHPMQAGAVVHWLRTEGRDLAAEDVFAKASAWKSFLRNTCYQSVKREGFVETPEDLNDMAEDPQRWIFAPDGLMIRFNPYEVAPYTEGMPEIVIPWSDLKPYLASTSPVPVVH